MTYRNSPQLGGRNKMRQPASPRRGERGENLSLYDLSPRDGRKRDSDERTMGVVLTHPTSGKKNYRSSSSTPRAGRKRDSGERTMGVVLTHPTSGKKNYRSSSSTPRAGRKRDSGERTMGVSVNPPDIGQEKLSPPAPLLPPRHRARKIIALAPLPPRREETGLRREDDGGGFTPLDIG